jgi:hypothetical protein
MTRSLTRLFGWLAALAIQFAIQALLARVIASLLQRMSSARSN